LIVNGEVRESKAVSPYEDRGTWNIAVEKSSWIALLVRGTQGGRGDLVGLSELPAPPTKPARAAQGGRAKGPRGRGEDQYIMAHSSPVMVDVAGSAFMAAADALSILQQVEGMIAYLDTISIRADVKTYQRMRLLLTSAHRSLHNRMHQNGVFHQHAPANDHEEHRAK
jgi:hypothetical protein